MYPHVYDIWKKRFNLDCYIILIAEKIPENLKNLEKYIILFDSIPNINDIFIAQNIRILYPALFENKNILITDIDIVPISKKHFIDSVEKYSDNNFISYTNRYLNQNMLAICYNLANSDTWKKIFKINNKNDIINILKSWYVQGYDGKKNCDGWFTDQKKLFEYVENFRKESEENKNKVIILNDKDIFFKRLDKRQRDIDNIIKNKENYLMSIENYSDFHISKRIWVNSTYKKVCLDIFNKLKTN